ncbi:MAG: Mur ligase family protein, partial [Ignavibacteria bacterium]
MENYFLAKKKLFDSLNENAFAIINFDDEYGRKIISDTKAKVISYGFSENVDFRFINPKYSFDQIEFEILYKGKTYPVLTNLTGIFNVYNLTASIATCVNLGIELEQIQEAVRNISRIPGRFELVGNYPVKVIVDYAHTSDALMNVIQTIRLILNSNNSKGKIITVFGAGGDRDRTKRPKMGSVVEELSDFAIITSDNPRNEELSQIFNDILSGINDKSRFHIIDDREMAIRKAIQMAKDGDIVLVAGKGHEAYQLVKGQKIPFDDRKVALKILKEMFEK